MTPVCRLSPSMRIGSREFVWGSRTYLMGIVNVTPDSFSGDGVGLDVAAARARAIALASAGADIIDLGGESTRPGHTPVDVDEELRRVLPALCAIVAAVDLPISIDTRKAAIAREAVARGAALVNDVSGLMGDAAMAGVVCEAGVPALLMARGAGRQEDVLDRVRGDLDESLAVAEAHGIPRSRLLIDPGFGFGKTWRMNLELLGRLRELRGYGLPIVAGLSRKSTIARVLGPGTGRSLEANAALTTLAVAGGAEIVRVHDVAQMRIVARTADAVVRGAPPEAVGEP
ncbi:MAG TPA: dihydropteroate synthase [Dehalococcoidia bacterium]|nr:dihydropteroate synthase [Dehalococcoidia bacterium]